MFSDRDFWEIVLSAIPGWFLIIVTIYTLSYGTTIRDIPEIGIYSVLYSFLTGLMLYRMFKNAE